MTGKPFTFLLMALLLLPVGMSSEAAKPLILIYSPRAPDYGRELQRLIQEDGRVEAEFQVLESPEVFRMMMYFPNVKAIILTLVVDNDQGLGPTLDWFFSSGGGLIALGMAASEEAIGNSSQTVFPLFATGYRIGAFDPKTRRFSMTHIKEDEDEISRGISSFTVPDHKVVLSFDIMENAYVPRYPEEGEYKVLFREENTGAPSIVKYTNTGVSVTFASFAGDDHVPSYSYYAGFTETDAFRTLFTNAVHWIWTNEDKYERHMTEAGSFYEDQRDALQLVKEEAEGMQSGAKTSRLARMVLTLALAGLACAGIYWVTFVRAPRPLQ
jgi:hypothetical protein